MAGAIYRRKKEAEFVTLDTHCLRNKDLKWEAKGLHCYIMQLKDDWQLNISDLEKRSASGREATTSPLNALISHKYIYRQRKHNEAGHFDGYDYWVFERPEYLEEWLIETGNTINGKTVNGKSVNGSTVNGKPATNKDEDYNLNGYSNKDEGSEDANSNFPDNQPPTETPPPSDKTSTEPTIRLGHRPNAETATELLASLSAFYKEYSNEWKYGILELGKGRRHTAEQQKEIVTDFCCWAIGKNMGNDTYRMLNASLQSWFRNEQYVTWKKEKPANSSAAPSETTYTPPKKVFRAS